jgi:hypothetical protein
MIIVSWRSSPDADGDGPVVGDPSAAVATGSYGSLTSPSDDPPEG